MTRPITIRLLVIDGQPATHAGIRALAQNDDRLRRVKVKEHTALTFEDGLAAVHDEVPDVILLDVNLPQASPMRGPVALQPATSVKTRPGRSHKRRQLPYGAPTGSSRRSVASHEATLSMGSERRSVRKSGCDPADWNSRTGPDPTSGRIGPRTHGAINLFRATSRLRLICPQTPILLLYAPPAPLASALLLLLQKQADGLLAKADLNAARLDSAITRLRADAWHRAGGQYLYYGGQEHKLADLTRPLGFSTLADEQVRLVELLDQTDCVPTIAAELSLTASSVYRQLQKLSVKFGARDWKDVTDRAQQLGILDQGQVVCPAAFSKFGHPPEKAWFW